MKKSIVLALALCMLLAIFATGCGGNNKPSGDTAGGNNADGKVSGTISLIMLKTNEPGMTAVIEDFAKEYPDIKIETEFIGDLTAFDTQVPTRFASGSGSDLIHLIAGGAAPVSVVRFSEAGHLVDLSDQPWVSNMYESTKDLMMYDGKVMAKDFGFCPLASLMYDKDYFDEHNLKAPTTYAEQIEVCKQIKELGMVPISWSAGEVFVNINNVVVMAGNTVFSKEPDWLDKRLKGETTFASSEGWRTAITQVKELIDLGAFAPGAAAMNQTEMIANFASGQAAMMFTYGGMAGLVRQQTPDMNIGMVAFPAVDPNDTRVIAQAAGGVAISSKSQNREAAEIFLDFWSRPEEADKFADGSSIISANQARTGKLTGTYSELSGLFAEGKVIGDPTAGWPNTSFNEKAGTSFQGLFTGQKSVDDVLADLDTFFEE